MHTSTAYVYGTWAAAIVLLICIIWAVTAILISDFPEIAIIPGLIALITIAIYVFATWPPFDMRYHTYRYIGGTISAISPRLLSDGKSTTESFAVQFGSDQTYRCDDTRCSLLKPGDALHLWCIRQFQWNATEGYQCNFADSRHSG